MGQVQMRTEGNSSPVLPHPPTTASEKPPYFWQLGVGRPEEPGLEAFFISISQVHAE